MLQDSENISTQKMKIMEEILKTSNGVEVVSSVDMGDFYCKIRGISKITVLMN